MATRTHPNARPPRVDWDAARAFYIALGQGNRTYAIIATRFGVSEASVRKWARRQDWPAAAARADIEVARRAEARALKSLEERQAGTIRAADKLRERIERADLEQIDLTAAIRSLPRYAALEQLFAGEATSRVEVAEVQAYVVALVTAAGEFVPVDRRQEFLDRVRELESGFGGGAFGEAA